MILGFNHVVVCYTIPNTSQSAWRICVNACWVNSLARFKCASSRARRAASDNAVSTLINLIRAGYLFVILNSNLIAGLTSPLNCQSIRFVVVTWQVLDLFGSYKRPFRTGFRPSAARQICFKPDAMQSVLPFLPLGGSHSDNLIPDSNSYM